jgi:hypothetical protein
MAVAFMFGSGSSGDISPFDVAYGAPPPNVTRYYSEGTQWVDGDPGTPYDVIRFTSKIEWLDDEEFVHPDVADMIPFTEMRQRAQATYDAMMVEGSLPSEGNIAQAPASTPTPEPEPPEPEPPTLTDISSEPDGGNTATIVMPTPIPTPDPGNQGGAPNPPLASVNNVGGISTITYSNNTINLTTVNGLFTIDANAGTPAFTIEAGSTGAGTINGNILTVTRAGDFNIGLITAQTSSHSAGAMVLGELAVLRGAGTTVEVPTIKERGFSHIAINETATLSSGQKVEYSISTNPNIPSENWQYELVFDGLDTTTIFYIFARSAENDLFSAGGWMGSAVSNEPTWIILENGTAVGSILAVPRGETAFVPSRTSFTNRGTVLLNENSRLIVEGDFFNVHRVFVDRSASLNVEGLFANIEGSIVDNRGDINVTPVGEFVNAGVVTNRDRANIAIENQFVNTLERGTLNESGIIYNFHKIEIKRGGRLVNRGGAFIHNRTNAEIHVEGNGELVNEWFPDAVRIQNDGNIFIYLGGALLNYGRIMNRPPLPPTPPGRIINEGIIEGGAEIEGHPIGSFFEEY